MRLQFLTLLVAAPALAQGLPDFLAGAQAANLDVQQGAEARELAEAEFAQAWGGLLPSLTASGGWTHNQYDAVLTLPTATGAGDTVTIIPKNQFEATLRAEVPLLDPARWLRTASASASAQAAALREQATRVLVQRQVVSAFYGLVGAQAVLESARRSHEAAAAQVEVTLARTSAGVANELDLMRARAEVERTEQLVADAEALVAVGERTLETLSGVAPRKVPLLPDDDLHPEPPLESLEAGAAALPAVEAADGDARAAERLATAARLALAPTVNAQFTQRFTNATGFQGAAALYNAGLTFNWRLDVAAVQGLRAQAAQSRSVALAAERARQVVRDQAHADWHQVKAAVKKQRAAGAQVTAARRAAALARERSQAGVATQLEVLQAERDLFSAEVSAIQAASGLASARALLSLSTGRDVGGAP